MNTLAQLYYSPRSSNFRQARFLWKSIWPFFPSFESRVQNDIMNIALHLFLTARLWQATVPERSIQYAPASKMKYYHLQQDRNGKLRAESVNRVRMKKKLRRCEFISTYSSPLMNSRCYVTPILLITESRRRLNEANYYTRDTRFIRSPYTIPQGPFVQSQPRPATIMRGWGDILYRGDKYCVPQSFITIRVVYVDTIPHRHLRLSFIN